MYRKDLELDLGFSGYMRGLKSLLHGVRHVSVIDFFLVKLHCAPTIESQLAFTRFFLCAEGNLPNYSAPNNEFRRFFGQIPILFWYVFCSRFIGKIGNSGIVNHPPIVFFIWIIELERATSVSQAPPPQHYPWHPPRSTNAAQQFQDEVLSAVSSAQSEMHQKLQDRARAHVRKGTRKILVKWLFRSNQMVSEFYAYLIVSDQCRWYINKYTWCFENCKFSTHFVICAYQDQQCDSGLSKGRGWSRVDFLLKSTWLHPLPFAIDLQRCKSYRIYRWNIRGRKPECFETIGIANCEKTGFLRERFWDVFVLLLMVASMQHLGFPPSIMGTVFFRRECVCLSILLGHEV